MAKAGTKDKQLNFRVNEEVYAAFEKGAAECGMSLSAWLTQLGLTALGRSPLQSHLAQVADPVPKRRRR